MASYRSIEFPAGTRRVLEFNLTYSQDWSVEGKRGQAIAADDISAAIFKVKSKLETADADAAITKSIDSGIAKADGKATVTLAPADTKALHGQYFATLRLFLADGAVVDFEDTEYANIPYVGLVIRQGAVEAVTSS